MFRYSRMNICELCTHKWRINPSHLAKIEERKR